MRPMPTLTIQAYPGFGLGRYVGAATFQANNALEAEYIHLLVKVEDFRKEGTRGEEWFLELMEHLRQPLNWTEVDPRIRQEAEGYEPHQTIGSALTRTTKPKLPKPPETLRKGHTLAENQPKAVAKPKPSVSKPVAPTTAAAPKKPKVVVRIRKP